jgi:hypothetical protein
LTFPFSSFAPRDVQLADQAFWALLGAPTQTTGPALHVLGNAPTGGEREGACISLVFPLASLPQAGKRLRAPDLWAMSKRYRDKPRCVITHEEYRRVRPDGDK